MIEIKNLSRNFGTIKAVDDVSFTINRGDVVGFLGPNGAGKTTTMRMMVGYLQPSAGEILHENISIYDNPMHYATQIGYLPEHNPLYEDMLVLNYLQYIGKMRGIKPDTFATRLDYVVDKCGLNEVMAQTIGTLSKGYRQRVGLAQAIIHDPSVLILDEPTSGLDPNQIIEIRDLITELGHEKTVILSSHIMQEVQAVCNRIIIINHGKIIADAEKNELHRYLSGSHKLYAEIEADNPVFDNWLTVYPEVKLDSISLVNNVWHAEFTVPADYDYKRELARFIAENNWLTLSLYTKQPNLEEIFQSLTLNINDTMENTEPEPIETTDESTARSEDESDSNDSN